MDEQELFGFDIEYASEYSIRYSKDAREISELLYFAPKPMIEHIKGFCEAIKRVARIGW